jgi:hypothetical protein
MSRIRSTRMGGQPMDGLSRLASKAIDAIEDDPTCTPNIRVIVLITDGHTVGNGMRNFPHPVDVIRFLELNIEAFQKWLNDHN